MKIHTRKLDRRSPGNRTLATQLTPSSKMSILIIFALPIENFDKLHGILFFLDMLTSRQESPPVTVVDTVIENSEYAECILSTL